MTDANLMDAPCVHGNVWYDCTECEWPSWVDEAYDPISGE